MSETDSTGGHHPADDTASDGTGQKGPAFPTPTPDEAAIEPPDDTPEGFEPV
ncbi:hypothetical protein FHR32_007435 [Streptosporangium album]|uniref:Uncharacterized protein n=1 Tax=Streptosporangium album TaxID=47479 RepID=A0A7W7WE35_9ACTN|nr:hypothetical protein [Streptosporangium album]MBB4943035.1 hypothetical protein [Streptosporangium album]